MKINKYIRKCWVYPFLPSEISKRGSWTLVHSVQGNQKIEWTPILFGKTETRVGRYNLAVFLGVYYPSKILLWALREVFLPDLQYHLPLEP